MVLYFLKLFKNSPQKMLTCTVSIVTQMSFIRSGNLVHKSLRAGIEPVIFSKASQRLTTKPPSQLRR